MKKVGKRVAAIAAVATMAMASLAGCAGKVNSSEVVATVGDKEITAGVANFFIRYQQSSVEGYYELYTTENVWILTDEAGVTNEETFRKDVVSSLQELYILESHMGEYEVTISDEELAAITTAAETFLKENAADVKKTISGEQAVVEEVLRLMTIGEKMDKAIKADVDTNVSDDEAAQKAMSYIKFETKEEADDFLTKAKENGDLAAYAETVELEASTLTFDAESTALATDVIKAADALDEKEFSSVIETESGIYVVQLTSTMDKEATEAEKANIVAERQTEKYNEVVDAWKAATEMTVNEKVLEKINLADIKVTMKIEETEETTTE